MRKTATLALLNIFSAAIALTLAAGIFVRADAAEYLHLKTYYCDIYYAGPLPQALAGMADEYCAALSADFGVDAKPTIIVCKSSEEFSQQEAEGAYKSGVAYVLSDGAALAHELTHFYVDAKTRGNHPRWLTEGAALYYEKRLTGQAWRADLAGTALSLDDLFYKFNEYNTAVSYRAAYEEIERYTDKNGENGLQAVFSMLGDGADAAKIWH